jgi:hypothetical protein
MRNDRKVGKGETMKRLLAVMVLFLLTAPLGADRTRAAYGPQTTQYWVALHFATWNETQARLAHTGGQAALVHTGDPDYPYVLVEKWLCGSCYIVNEPLYMVEPQSGNYMPIGGKFKAANAPDGTTLLVWRK